MLSVPLFTVSVNKSFLVDMAPLGVTVALIFLIILFATDLLVNFMYSVELLTVMIPKHQVFILY